MMSLFIWIVGFSLMGSIGSIAGAALFMLFPEGIRRFLVPILVSYATGTLLGAAFLGMIPAALEEAAAEAVMATVLAGLVVFFILEKLVLWRHSHACEPESRDPVFQGRAGPLVLVGDTFHNLVDGVVIAAAFLTTIPLGVAASLAVIAHEIPQEIGDFAILLESGYSRLRALVLNGLSSAATLPGAIAAYYWLDVTQEAVPYILAVSAASFVYIAVADLIPGLHRQVTLAASIRQLALLVLGVATIVILHH